MHGENPQAVEDWLREGKQDDDRRYTQALPMLPGKRLLDFGCGPGGFLLRARNTAAEVCGLEPEQRLKSHFAHHGLQVVEGTKDLADRKFDLITAFHVVEHLPDPRAVLRELATLLADGGQIVIEVPNSDDALLTLYRSAAFAQFTYWSQHLFLFNPSTMRALVAQAGLRLVWLKQVQRYPLSNHLHWLAVGKPGGHRAWSFLDSSSLNEQYENQLAALGCCDTLMAGIARA